MSEHKPKHITKTNLGTILIVVLLVLFGLDTKLQRPEPTATPLAAKSGQTAALAHVPPSTAIIISPTSPVTATHQPPAVPTESLPTLTATVTETAVPPTHTPEPAQTAPPPVLLPTPTNNVSLTVKVPILMYHYISTPPEDADKYRIDLSVEPDAFRSQMAYLAENGYTTISFYDLSLAVTNNQPLPEKPVILTFDDGYLDNYEIAYPILQEYGLHATFFVVTEFIDRGREGYLTWEMVQEMAAAGHNFEPHSRTHPELTNRDRDYLIWEMLGPQETLAYHIGYTPRYFSYPSGRYDDAVIGMAQELGYWGAVTTYSGKEHSFIDRYTWTRMRIRHNTPLAEFVDLVNSN